MLASAVGFSVGAGRLQSGCNHVTQLTSGGRCTTAEGGSGAEFGFQPLQLSHDGGPLG